MAVNDTLVFWSAFGSVQPASSAMVYSPQGSYMTLRAFAGQRSLFDAVMPRHYSGRPIRVRIHFAADGNTGSVTFQAEFDRRGPTDVFNTDTFAPPATATTPVPATAGTVGVCSIICDAPTNTDGVTRGDYFRLRVTRNNDTAPTVFIVAVTLEEA